MASDQIFLITQRVTIDPLIAQLRTLGDKELNLILKDLAKLAGVAAEQWVVIYPPQPEPRPEKPRYSKKTGKLLKPRKRARYVRTGKLGSSITSGPPIQVEPLAWFTFVGTNTTYAPYVVGSPDDPPPKHQAWFHQGVWTPMVDSLRLNIFHIVSVIEAELQKRIKERLGG